MDGRETFGVALSRQRKHLCNCYCGSHGHEGSGVGKGNQVPSNAPEQIQWTLDPGMEGWGGGWGTWPFMFMHTR